MTFRRRGSYFRADMGILSGAAIVMPMLAASIAAAQIDGANWGSVTAPVFGASQAGKYAGAELFTGPNQFGSYFSGVLPNGRKVTPAGQTVQIGMNPLGCALTPDGKYLVTSNDDERGGGLASLQSPGVNAGGYSLSVIRTADMKVVSQINPTTAFIGLAIKRSGSTYTVYASGGASATGNALRPLPPGVVRLFKIDGSTGAISVASPTSIEIDPITPGNRGYVSNYTVAPNSQAKFSASTIYRPAGYNTAGAKITFPAGSALSPDSKYLYVACNGDNSLAVIDTTTNTLIGKPIPVGYFPYGVSVSADGSKVFVTNWGVTEYRFNFTEGGADNNVAYDDSGMLTTLNPINSHNLPDGFYVPPTDPDKTSSISVISIPGGNPANATWMRAISEAQPGGIDPLKVVGETHPSACAIVKHGGVEVLYVCKANSDSIGMIALSDLSRLQDFDLSPLQVTLAGGHKVHGAYPNAIAVSSDGSRAYVAEAGINSVAVLDTTNPTAPRLVGRIPTDWYPTGVSLSADGKTLYIINAKGIGEDINPATRNNPPATGIESFSDSNYIFGTAQKVDLARAPRDSRTVLSNNFSVQRGLDTSVVPLGGAASSKIKHVFFILGENKTFDSFLGDLGGTGHFGNYAGINFNNSNGGVNTDYQFTQIVPNLRLLATTFATAVNYYSDAEESDAGHQFSASGTASDYTEKTLLNKGGRGMLVNKNFEAEDYPEGGYIFNNAARNGVSFKLYGLEAARIIGSDTGDSTPATLNDPKSGASGAPQVDSVTYNGVANTSALRSPFTNPVPGGDVNTQTSPGVGQTFFMKYPGLAVLGSPNPNGEPRLDPNYPGYNFNISDQRRAREFIADFDHMNTSGTLPQFLYIYVPNMHTGGVRADPIKSQPSSLTGPELVADGDVAIGMIVEHIMRSSVYYSDPDKGGNGTGSVIFFAPDDSQSTLDHIHEHRAPLIAISPYARPGYLAKKHYSTASTVKTEELLLGLPPNNYGDLFATDLRDMFQPSYNGITIASIFNNGGAFTRTIAYQPTPEGRKIWALVKSLDTSAPDRDSLRLGVLNRLTMKADALHKAAVKKGHLSSKLYRAAQARLYQLACNMVKTAAPRDADD
jgi:YVTN family beta-propeller protein